RKPQRHQQNTPQQPKQPQGQSHQPAHSSLLLQACCRFRVIPPKGGGHRPVRQGSGICPDEVRRAVSRHLQGVTGHVPLHMGKDVLRRQSALPPPGLQAPDGHRRSGGSLIQGSLHVGKLPQARQQAGPRPLPQGDLSVPHQQEHRLLLHPAGLFGPLHWQILCRAPKAALAEGHGRTLQTPGRAVGCADRGPQLHGGLIEDADIRLSLRHDGLDLCPHGLFYLGIGNIVPAVRQPHDHPQHVAVHRRFPSA
ncbi:Recombinase domain-containing protein, partial [Dysosmobacter welbionis]